MPRRRKSDPVVLLIVLGALFGVFAAFSLAISPFGLLLGIVLIVGALLYGAQASWSQSTDQRLWDHVKDISALSGLEFEKHVAETYSRLGYRVQVTKASGDAGVDVIAEMGAERLAIQTKQYAGSVGNDSVQQAFTGKTIYNCTGAVVVCSSTFTSAAQAAARATNVELIDGKAYGQMMQHTQPKAVRSYLPFPSGPPLAKEMYALGAGVLVLFVHSMGPSLIPSNNERIAPTATSTAASYTPPPQYQVQPALTSPTQRPRPIRRAEAKKALPSPHPTQHVVAKHPPWWTPTPEVSPSPIPVESEEAANPVPSPEVSPIASVSPEPTAEDAPSASPTSSP
jgi:protein-disulfide isomerase-like protein with CxxC motif